MSIIYIEYLKENSTKLISPAFLLKKNLKHKDMKKSLLKRLADIIYFNYFWFVFKLSGLAFFLFKLKKLKNQNMYQF